AGVLRAALTAPAVGRLREVARSHHTTLFTLLLSAFGCAVSWASGQPDLVIGSPVAGRTRPQLEALIGSFATVLPLRLNLSGRPSADELIGRTREVVTAALADQELPPER